MASKGTHHRQASETRNTGAMDNIVLSVCNGKPKRLPGPSLLHQLVAPPSPELALHHLSHGVRTAYTYQQLHEAADRLAAVVAGIYSDCRGEFIVPVLLHQSPELYVGLVAILKAGGAFCPLNIDAPPERLGFIFQDIQAKAVLTTEGLAQKIPSGSAVQAVSFLVDGLCDTKLPNSVVRRSPQPQDLAYVMYTSGSTGTPKGVGITHDAATQALLAHDLHIPPFARFLQFASPTFDVSVFEIFFPLYKGKTLVSVSRDELLDDLPAAMRAADVDACELTPTVAASLLRSRLAVPNLKLLLTIGEMLKMPVIQEFGGDSRVQSMLWAMYGPTEATIHWYVTRS